METEMKSAKKTWLKNAEVVLRVDTVEVYPIIYVQLDNVTDSFFLVFHHTLVDPKWLNRLMPSLFLDESFGNTCTEKLCGTCFPQAVVCEVPFHARIAKHLTICCNLFLPNGVSQTRVCFQLGRKAMAEDRKNV